jgi:hypothetical protein
MASVPDKNKIEFLVSRRFRGISLAPAPFLPQRYVQSASFSDERNFRKQSSVRETMEAYRTKLQAMTSDEVTALYEAELAKLEAERVKERTEQRAKAEKQESERFFNLQSAMASVHRTGAKPRTGLSTKLQRSRLAGHPR